MNRLNIIGLLLALSAGGVVDASSVVDGPLLAQEIKEQVSKFWNNAGYEAIVSIARTPRTMEGSCGTLSWALPDGAVENKIGHTRVPVRILRKGRVVEEMQVAIHVTVRAHVAVVSTPMRRLMTISSETLRWEDQWVDVHPHELVLTAARLTGKRLRRDVPAGTRLAMAYLEEDPPVKRGDTVDVTALQGAIRLTLRGVAENDGQINESVRVKSIDTGRIFVAQVSGTGELQIR